MRGNGMQCCISGRDCDNGNWSRAFSLSFSVISVHQCGLRAEVYTVAEYKSPLALEEVRSPKYESPLAFRPK